MEIYTIILYIYISILYVISQIIKDQKFYEFYDFVSWYASQLSKPPCSYVVCFIHSLYVNNNIEDVKKENTFNKTIGNMKVPWKYANA